MGLVPKFPFADVAESPVINLVFIKR